MTTNEAKNNGFTEYSNNQNDRGAVADGSGYTVFGFWENGVLRCAYGKPSKVYANPGRAAKKWMNQ